MKPGRELDALIAEKVMGLANIEQGANAFGKPTVTSQLRDGFVVGIKGAIPHYSTDIAAAWEVLENIIRKGPFREKFALEWMPHPNLEQSYWAVFSTINSCIATSKTAPHAICLAALKAGGAL